MQPPKSIESNTKPHSPQLEKPFSETKPDPLPDQQSHETVVDVDESKPDNSLQPNKAEVEEEECVTTVPTKSKVTGRERLKRHRVEVAGRVWIPDMWGQEGLLKDWVDCAAFDASLVNNSIVLARNSLVEQGRRRASSTTLTIENSF